MANRHDIDWDKSNVTNGHVVVSAPDIVYSVENLILNPATVGFYILQNYGHKLAPESFGLDPSLSFAQHFGPAQRWQLLADTVTKTVLQAEAVDGRVKCEFACGAVIMADHRYVHMQGHELEERIKEFYPFLREHNKTESALKLDVIRVGMIGGSDGRTIPKSVIDLFAGIQEARVKHEAV